MLLDDQPAEQLIAQRIAGRAQRTDCLAVGLCGPQGSGKSTLAAVLKDLLEERGLVVAALSIDDFYLPRSTREMLGSTVHPLLKTRGVPGTHDISLALRVFAALHKPGEVSLPTFDKASDDRVPEDRWRRVRAPVQVILFEGWCVGAIPQASDALSEPVNALEREEDPQGIWRRYVNEQLAGDYQLLFRQIDFLILLATPAFEIVYRWRLQQENDLRRKVAEQGGDASRLMSDRQLERFIGHYERLTRHILAEMPARANLLVRLDATRRKTF